MSSLPQPAWIALADGGPLAGLGQVEGARPFRSTADPVAFTALLRTSRPRIVILGTPPAGRGDLDVALHERRRRPSLRIVVVCASEAIEDRLIALRAGVDEAHPDTMEPSELVARLAILEERTQEEADDQGDAGGEARAADEPAGECRPRFEPLRHPDLVDLPDWLVGTASVASMTASWMGSPAADRCRRVKVAR